MTDHSAAIARMLFEGKGIFGRCDPDDFPAVVDLILDRWPSATADEIERGFRIAIELGQAEAAELAGGRA